MLSKGLIPQTKENGGGSAATINQARFMSTQIDTKKETACHSLATSHAISSDIENLFMV